MKKNSKFPYINIGEYLGDVLDQIPSHIVFFKVIPGAGATAKEVEDQLRNSIICEPNVPVIQGKCKKYNEKKKIRVFGVYEGKTVDQIMDYLESKVTPKKLITTPESYPKIKEAMEELGIDMFNEYFMLFDECERTIQDVSYRSNILLPMNDFFKFKKKAFISATPIIPSDPRFEEQGFKHLYLKPLYDYSEKLTLIDTNNIFFTIKQFLQNNPREQYFIFLNTTDTIAKLITYLNVESESAIFCAKESMQKLKVNCYKHVSTSLGEFKKYNFLTSRFFSAVDIEGIVDPTIIMVTDLVSAEHSMIDPHSEAVQIVGRFRKPKDGTINKEVVHISNFNANLTSKSKEQILEQVSVWQKVYSVLKRFFNAATRVVAKEVVQEMMKRVEFSKYVNADGSKNYFMQDNTLHEEKVKGYYQSVQNLKKAYSEGKYFKVEHRSEKYEYSDTDNQQILGFGKLKTVFEVVMPIIKDLHEPEKHNLFHTHFQMEQLKKEFPDVVKAFNVLGLEEARRLKFNPKSIKNAIRLKEIKAEETHFGFMSFIEQNFKEGEPYSSKEIYNRTLRGLKENGLSRLKPGVRLLRKYCELSSRVWVGTDENGNGLVGYRIVQIYHTYKN